MFVIIGFVIVIGSILGGYMAGGGELYVLFQPFEFIIILGSGLGGFIIANPMNVVKGAAAATGRIFKGARYDKAAYIELISVMYQVFKLAKAKGMLALEQHVENPHESTLFQQFPNFAKNHHAMTFICDYLRMMTLGAENSMQIEDLMNAELEVHHAELAQVSGAVTTVADGLPALGIVAAVLGVIHTMGSISEPPAVLGHLIGAALVGTFSGVLFAYGFVGPIANAIKSIDEADSKYLQCIKAGLLAHLQGYPPAVSVEFARKALLHDVRPTFYEVEDAMQTLPPI